MNNEIKTLQDEKIRIINILSNCLYTIKNNDEIAYFIHSICEAKEITAEMYNTLDCYKIKANSDIFITVKK